MKAVVLLCLGVTLSEELTPAVVESGNRRSGRKNVFDDDISGLLSKDVPCMAGKLVGECSNQTGSNCKIDEATKVASVEVCYAMCEIKAQCGAIMYSSNGGYCSLHSNEYAGKIHKVQENECRSTVEGSHGCAKMKTEGDCLATGTCEWVDLGAPVTCLYTDYGQTRKSKGDKGNRDKGNTDKEPPRDDFCYFQERGECKRLQQCGYFPKWGCRLRTHSSKTNKNDDQLPGVVVTDKQFNDLEGESFVDRAGQETTTGQASNNVEKPGDYCSELRRQVCKRDERCGWKKSRCRLKPNVDLALLGLEKKETEDSEWAPTADDTYTSEQNLKDAAGLESNTKSDGTTIYKTTDEDGVRYPWFKWIEPKPPKPKPPKPPKEVADPGACGIYVKRNNCISNPECEWKKGCREKVELNYTSCVELSRRLCSEGGKWGLDCVWRTHGGCYNEAREVSDPAETGERVEVVSDPRSPESGEEEVNDERHPIAASGAKTIPTAIPVTCAEITLAAFGEKTRKYCTLAGCKYSQINKTCNNRSELPLGGGKGGVNGTPGSGIIGIIGEDGRIDPTSVLGLGKQLRDENGYANVRCEQYKKSFICTKLKNKCVWLNGVCMANDGGKGADARSESLDGEEDALSTSRWSQVEVQGKVLGKDDRERDVAATAFGDGGGHAMTP